MTAVRALAGAGWRSLSYAGVLLLGAGWIAVTSAMGCPLLVAVAPAGALLVAWSFRGARPRRAAAVVLPEEDAEDDEQEPHAPAYHTVNRAEAG